MGDGIEDRAGQPCYRLAIASGSPLSFGPPRKVEAAPRRAWALLALLSEAPGLRCHPTNHGGGWEWLPLVYA